MERHKKDDILFIYRFIYNFLFYSFRSKNINAVSKNDLLKTNIVCGYRRQMPILTTLLW